MIDACRNVGAMKSRRCPLLTTDFSASGLKWMKFVSEIPSV